MNDYRIERVQTDYAALNEVLQLMQLAFVGHSEKFSYEYLKWQYADNPIEQIDFLNTPFVPIPETILYKYSTKGLVDDIFGDL